LVLSEFKFPKVGIGIFFNFDISDIFYQPALKNAKALFEQSSLVRVKISKKFRGGWGEGGECIYIHLCTALPGHQTNKFLREFSNIWDMSWYSAPHIFPILYQDFSALYILQKCDPLLLSY
jgi:hypothetical protein